MHTTLLFAGAVVVFGLLAVDARSSAETHAAKESTDLAATVAAESLVIDLVSRAHDAAATDRAGSVADASAQLQPYAERVMDTTEIDYLTVMDTDRTRYTHRNTWQIGRAFVGTTAPALRGETFTEVYDGTLGPSVRAVVPVTDADGRVVGMVSAGVTLDRLWDSIVPRLIAVGVGTLLAFATGAVAAAILARRLDRITESKGPDELAHLFAAHEAVLHSVEEGMLLVEDGSVVLANDEALRLLDVADLAAPFAVADPRLSPAARDVLTGTPEGPVRVGDRVLLVSRDTAAAAGRNVGEVVSLRDRTELQRVTGELSSVRTISEALRAQTHEFSNRLHTIATLIELGRSDEALRFVASERDLGQRLTDRVVQAIEEPVIAALVLGKAAQARERAVEMHFETHLAPGTHWLEPVDVVTVLGNLIDNATDAAAARALDGAAEEAWVEVYLANGDDGSLVFQVSDSGTGIARDDVEHIFDQGWSTKDAAAGGRGYGLALVRQVVESLGGDIEVSQGSGTSAGAVFTVTLVRP